MARARAARILWPPRALSRIAAWSLRRIGLELRRIVSLVDPARPDSHTAAQMEKGDLERRLAFVGLEPDDFVCLEGLRPILDRHADVLVAAFYRHLLSFGETRALLADSHVKRRLLRKQREYLLSLAVSSIDAEFVAARELIGVTHARVGLAPRWYLGAHAHYFSLLAPLIQEQFSADRYRADRTLGALMKLLMFDAQIALEAYIEHRERELQCLNQELAAAGRDLADEMRETRVELRDTERRARAAEQVASIATLVAGLAHEIGTPMGVIQGHAELLESSVADERGRWRLRTIREQIDRISRIIQALLDSARPRDAVRAPVSLDGVIETSLSFLAEKFRRRRVTVEKQVAAPAVVDGDAEKLQQLFLNLFLNAVDAMPDGGTLRIAASPSPDGGVAVRVGDTGAGIPAERLPRIFDPFYTTKPAGQGSGLGLVVARSIVLEHDALIDVTSEPGRGTEFRIAFPPRLSVSRPAPSPDSDASAARDAKVDHDSTGGPSSEGR